MNAPDTLPPDTHRLPHTLSPRLTAWSTSSYSDYRFTLLRLFHFHTRSYDYDVQIRIDTDHGQHRINSTALQYQHEHWDRYRVPTRNDIGLKNALNQP